MIKTLPGLDEVARQDGDQRCSVVEFGRRQGIDFILLQNLGLLTQHLRQHEFNEFFELGNPTGVSRIGRFIVAGGEYYENVNFKLHLP